MAQTLYEHKAHPHIPRNPNERHKDEQAHAGVNIRLAVWLTTHVGTMACAYVFLCIGVGSLVGVLTNNTLLALICGSLSSYVLQLVLLPILSVGQNVLSRKQELQADELYQTAQHNFHDTEQTLHHLDAQDGELLRQTTMLTAIMEHLLPDAVMPTAEPATPKPTPRRDARGRFVKREKENAA